MDVKDGSLFFNRELSWLEFNQRVLDEAFDETNPLLERVKFLAISASNLDEFFMVRIGGLHDLLNVGINSKDFSGFTTRQLLDAVIKRVRTMVAEQYNCYKNFLVPALNKNGIFCLSVRELKKEHYNYVRNYFLEEIMPVLTPRRIERVSQFPSFSAMGIQLVVRLAPEAGKTTPRYALVALPPKLSRFVAVPNMHYYLFAEEIIAEFVSELFPGQKVMEVVPFRITRNSNMSVKEEEACDLLQRMQDVLDARKQSFCVRLEIAEQVSKTTLHFLYRALNIGEFSTYKFEGPLDFKDLFAIAGVKGYDNLKQEEWIPQPVPDFRPGETIFDTLARKDVVLMHPYEQYDPVVRLVQEAADDPNVLAIKQILYRTSKDSPIITALIRAAENGKSVTAFVELKARFDEAQNIKRAQELEQAGAQVIYGVQNLKTHAKLCFVVRKEPSGIRRYCHFGTGNYNESTAKLYSDVSYMTCNDDYGVDASAFFNTITGYSQPMNYHYLHAAPVSLKPRILSLIDAEIQRKKSGQKALIMAKVNSLLDLDVIEKLYEASQAGVKIKLNIRGICCLRPGIKGLSENIQVTSIIDRYLEHARIIYFHNGGAPEVLISSADWMPRNLIRRVELLVPVQDEKCKKKLISSLEKFFADNIKARTIYSDGTYGIERKKRQKRVQAQSVLYRDAVRAIERAKDVRLQHFEIHKPG